jgi:hypothetical protein
MESLVKQEKAGVVAQGHYQSAFQELTDKVAFVNEVAKSVLKKGEKGTGDFSAIPGCGDKPTLLKPGAEKICLAFGFVPKYDIERFELAGGHREYEITCHLYNREDVFQGSGVGVCSTMESKYRYREAQKKCPSCGKEAIIKGRQEYGGGWVCFDKKGGCRAKFGDKDPKITDQQTGRVENSDFADQYNTVKKIAKKRAFVDATITASASGSLFTQDLEDLNGFIAPPPEEKKPETQKQATPPANIPQGVETINTNPENMRMPDRLREQARNLILEMAGNDKTVAGDILQSITKWTNKDGKEVAGYRSTSKITDKAANVVYGKVKDAHIEWKKSSQPAEETPPVQEEERVECPGMATMPEGQRSKPISFCTNQCDLQPDCEVFTNPEHRKLGFGEDVDGAHVYPPKPRPRKY